MKNPIRSLNNLQQRVIVGILGIALFLGLIFWNWIGAVGLFSVIMALSLYEFYNLSPFKISKSWKMGSTLIGFLLFFLLVLTDLSDSSSKFRLLLFLSPCFLILLVFSGLEKPFESMAWIVTGWFYLITPWLCMLLLIGDFQYNPGLLLGLFGLLWSADSGAYFAGRTLGKTKLLPRVSPKKTWEGLIGGLICAGLFAYGLSIWVGVFTVYQWLILAASTTVFGTLGDLAESALKRSLDIKDSGNILPGHGGILDRFDGLFVAAPINYLIAVFFF
jgi:phosphatidate cytidylyltransferase